MDPEYIALLIMVAIILVGGYIRLEHRMTKIETLLNVIMGKMGLCLPNSEKDLP